MQLESLQAMKRSERPTLEQLEGYDAEYVADDPDYSMYRVELGQYLYDHGRRQEEKRERADRGRSPMPGHEPPPEGLHDGTRYGFDEDSFSLDQVVRVSASRPKH